MYITSVHQSGIVFTCRRIEPPLRLALNDPHGFSAYHELHELHIKNVFKFISHSEGYFGFRCKISEFVDDILAVTSVGRESKVSGKG